MTPWTETWAAVYGRWIGHPLCPVEVKCSGMCGAGSGVFARCAIPRGSFVTPFDGRLIPAHTRVQSRTWDYEYQMAHGGHLVPAMTRRAGHGVGHLLNDAIHPDVTGMSNNCYFHERGRASLWVRTRRDVAADEELLVAYGFQYWSERYCNMTLDPRVRRWCMLQHAMDRLLATCTIEEYLGCDRTGATYRVSKSKTKSADHVGDVALCQTCYVAAVRVHIDATDTIRCCACLKECVRL